MTKIPIHLLLSVTFFPPICLVLWKVPAIFKRTSIKKSSHHFCKGDSNFFLIRIIFWTSQNKRRTRIRRDKNILCFTAMYMQYIFFLCITFSRAGSVLLYSLLQAVLLRTSPSPRFYSLRFFDSRVFHLFFGVPSFLHHSCLSSEVKLNIFVSSQDIWLQGPHLAV